MSTPRSKAPAKPPKQNNPYGIDPKVWSKIVGRKKPTIERVMFAAALDPLLIHELGDIQPPRSFVECVQLGEMGTHGHGRDYLRGVLMQWVMLQYDLAWITLEKIAIWDIRLGVWCAAACAEYVLHFVPYRDNRPRLAIKAAKEWVFGAMDSAAAAHAANAANAAYAAANATANAARGDEEGNYFNAASAARDAAAAAQLAATAVVRGAETSPGASYSAAAATRHAVRFAAETARYAVATTQTHVIRDVIARAIESYPVDQP